MISRYGKAIERDLAWRGVDLATLWRARRWRTLLNLIDGLPRDSAYTDALTNDEAVAAQLAERPVPKAPVRRMSEFSVEVELLSALLDRVGELIQTVAATAGAKPQSIPPAPRPVTAIDRARRARREDRHKAIVSRLLPHKKPAA